MREAPLPEGYYLANFETVLSEVEARHGDLLLAEERDLLQRFRGLSLAAESLQEGAWPPAGSMCAC